MDTALRSPSNSGGRNSKTVAAFVASQIEARLRVVAFELRHVRQDMAEERVHDLRVALRRLMEGLRVGKDALAADGTRQVMKDLRKIMKEAGRVRACDIASDLLREAGATADAQLLQELAVQREQAERKLYEELMVAHQRKATMKWRAALQLGAGR
jgi:CHAD domain-containing protein